MFETLAIISLFAIAVLLTITIYLALMKNSDWKISLLLLVLGIVFFTASVICMTGPEIERPYEVQPARQIYQDNNGAEDRDALERQIQMAKIQETLAPLLGNRLRKFDIFRREDRSIFVTVDVFAKANMSRNVMRRAIAGDNAKIVRALHQSGLDIDGVDITNYIDLVDNRGVKRKSRGMQLTIGKENIRAIDWYEINLNDFERYVDKAWVHQTIRR